MKYFLSIFFLFYGSLQALASEGRPIDIQRAVLDSLLIEGKLSRAELMVGELPLESARRYYRALIAHIRGDYAKGLRELSWRKFSIQQYYTEICQLKVIHLWKTGRGWQEPRMPTPRESGAWFLPNYPRPAQERVPKRLGRQFDWESNICLSELSRFSSNGMLWFQALRNMAGRQATQIDPLVFGDRGGEVWLKAGLYLQRGDLVEKLISHLSRPEDENSFMKELVALHHYRMGRYRKAFKWAAKTSGVNASNILGRVFLAGGDFKSAWKHFKEAVEIRSDSLNALEYLPSLAWILNHWREGREFLLRLAQLRQLTSEELALLSAFYIQEGKLENARRSMGMLRNRFDNALPMEALLIGGYISLRQGEEIVPYVLPACLQGEGIHCWILLQRLNGYPFKGLPLREELLFGEDGEPDIDAYRQKVEINPLKEKIYILSKDIEELDHRIFNRESDLELQVPEEGSAPVNRISGDERKPPIGK